MRLGLNRAVLGMAVCVAGVMIAVAAGSASAQTAAAKAAAKRIEQTFGVKVLDSRVVKVDGRAAYQITVMNPGGDFNEAFQVNRLVVDAATGKLISGFRHKAAGYRLADPAPGAVGGRGP